MEEDLHLLRQQALRTLHSSSPKKRAIAPGILPHRPSSHRLLDPPDFSIDELLFREKLKQPVRRPRDDLSMLPPKGRHTRSPAGRKRTHQSRLTVHAKRRKQSSSRSSSGSAYSSSRSRSRSSYSSSRSSSHSHSSRTSSPSSRSRSFSSRPSSSYSRSTFSSSSRSPSASPHARSRKAKMTSVKPHKTLNKLVPNSKRPRTPPLVRSKDWPEDSLKYKPREDSSHRRKVLPHDSFSAEHGSYRHRGRSRSPHRLGDKFMEPSRRPIHYGHESPPRRHPRPHSPGRDRRVIRQIRRSPPPMGSDRHPRGRTRRSLSPPVLRHRNRHSPPLPPPPPPPMRRRPRTRSLERPERPRRARSLERAERPRRPAERVSLGREEPQRRLRDRSRRDDAVLISERHRHSTRSAREGGSNSRSSRRTGKPLSDTEQEGKKRVEKKTVRRESAGGGKNGVGKTKEQDSLRKEEGVSEKEHDMFQTDFETSDLLGDYEFDVELDYDETMEDVEASPDEDPKPTEDDDKDVTLDSDPLPNISQTDNSPPLSPSLEAEDHECSPSDEETKFVEEEAVEKISSPIRVSPDRERDRSRRGRESSGKRSSDGKLSVKDRLYVSKQTIVEKRRAVTTTESKSSLRPSLASRLGPSPHGRHKNDDFPSKGRRSKSRTLIKSSKGDAMAIAEAYRRKKRQEAVGLRKEEVQKAKKFTEMINHRGSKSSRRSHAIEDVENDKDREKALDKRINEIKEQNKAILKRNKEIEQDKELYG